MSLRFDVVVYGASGFTGMRIVESLLTMNEEKLTFAVAGRSETRLQKTLRDISARTGKDVSDVEIIIADSGDAESLSAMAKRARVIINAVGPYRFYGEPVVKAAVENGASYVDVSGEPAFLESMQLKYGDLAKEKGVYVVGSCGWDSVPCDLGIAFLKNSFPGQLSHAEAFVQIKYGPAGYSANAGTYQTLILGMANMRTDGLGKLRKALMPDKLPTSQFRPPKRSKLWYNDVLKAWCVPFMGSDKSVVSRSQYFDYTLNKQPPVLIETYIRIKSLIWAFLLLLWMVVFGILAQFEITRKVLQKYPELCSFHLFSNAGPTEEQIKQSSFTYWFIGNGWEEKRPAGEEHSSYPEKQVIVRCDGPDSGYISTSACVLSAALTILRDSDKMIPGGGVYTPAIAFKNTGVYSRLEKFGVTFRVTDVVTE